MFLLVELHPTALQLGVPGISPLDMWLRFVMMLGISMIPYALMYKSFGTKSVAAPRPARPSLFHRMAEWMHAHRHPVLHH